MDVTMTRTQEAGGVPMMRPAALSRARVRKQLQKKARGLVRVPPEATRAPMSLPTVTSMVAALESSPAPEEVATPSGRRLIQRTTMGFNRTEAAIFDFLGYQGYLNYQINYREQNDGPLEEFLQAALPTLAMPVNEVILRYYEQPEVPAVELLFATLLRSFYSPRQLFERMVVFWTDHFNINLFSSQLGALLKGADDRDVIRRHAMGRFPDLLRASATSTAMLVYLTNDSNVKGHPNENYARELMELHTMGADNGYTQEDVREVARCFTGWTFWGVDGGLERLGTFRFDASQHDNGRKVVLGEVIPAGGGQRDGERVLQILAEHPNTAQFISRKLLRYMWGYEPPQRYVDRVAASYQATGGDISSMLRVILKESWMSRATSKLKRPYHLVTSAVRSLYPQETDFGFLLQSLLDAGQLPFTWEPPNGFPDSREYWSAYILPRFNFAAETAEQETSGIVWGPDLLNPQAGPQRLARRLDWLLFDYGMARSSRGVVRRFLEGGPLTADRLDEAIGLTLASPDFQEY